MHLCMRQAAIAIFYEICSAGRITIYMPGTMKDELEPRCRLLFRKWVAPARSSILCHFTAAMAVLLDLMLTTRGSR
ncbi:hypothetical protein ASC80_02585 [Afipia sp. Root123D2]|nr:hypothetical protein ASC80_02585 [Afipia sp. Root123D2]